MYLTSTLYSMDWLRYWGKIWIYYKEINRDANYPKSNDIRLTIISCRNTNFRKITEVKQRI